MKYKTEAHRIWHRRIEGQLLDAMTTHPEWFAVRTLAVRRSIAKRIVGEILAGASKVPAGGAAVPARVPPSRAEGVALTAPSDGRGGSRCPGRRANGTG